MKATLTFFLLFISINLFSQDENPIEQCGKSLEAIGMKRISIDIENWSESSMEQILDSIKQESSSFGFASALDATIILPDSPIPIPFKANANGNYDESSKNELINRLKTFKKEGNRKKIFLQIPTKGVLNTFIECITINNTIDGIQINQFISTNNEISFNITKDNSTFEIKDFEIDKIIIDENMLRQKLPNTTNLTIGNYQSIPFIFERLDNTKPTFIQITYKNNSKINLFKIDPTMQGYSKIEDIARWESYTDPTAGITIDFNELKDSDNKIVTTVTTKDGTWNQMVTTPTRPSDFSQSSLEINNSVWTYNDRCFKLRYITFNKDSIF